MRKALVVVLLVAFTSSWQLSAAAPSAPALSFASDAVVVSGLKPGHRLLFFSVANEPRSYDAALVRRETVATTDAAGSARYEMPEGVPRRSIWFAIDISTGDYAVAAPPSFPLRRQPVTGLTLRGRSAAASDLLEVPFGYVEVLIVRPGSGVWRDSAGRGGGHDQNRGRPGRLTLSPSTLRAIAAAEPTPAPERITPTDLIILVNPYTLEFIAGHPAETGEPTP